jgi:heat shock protein HslJ
VTTVASQPLLGTVWQWDETKYNDGEIVKPVQAESFVLTFLENEQFSSETDCNNVMGQYVVNADMGVISFGQIASTKMACPDGSQEEVFTKMLEEVAGFVMRDDGTLALTLRDDSGSSIFTPVLVPPVEPASSDPTMHDEILGMAEEQAEKYAEEKKVSFRVTTRDGEGQPATMDYRPGRINATVEAGVVTGYSIE